MRWVSCFLCAACALPAFSAALSDALERGAELQRSEQPAEALRCFQEARVEYPEAAALLFAMGGAEVGLGDLKLKERDADEAIRRFESAKTTFERCGEDARLAESAAYNAATCLLRVDAALERKGDYEARLENLRAAVEALAAVVETYPGHERAAKNLDHARYRLALLLQNPPDPKKKDEEKPEDDEQPVSEVAGATTQIPNATAEIEDGAIVVLRVKPRREAAP